MMPKTDRHSDHRSLPTFIIAGAPRSGTSYVYRLFDTHPDIYMASPMLPEPKYFLVDEEYRRGLDYYSTKYFASAAKYLKAGEKSTNYLEVAGVAERIHESLPKIQLIFVLRDPVERAFSNYLWSNRNGLETLSFEEALRRDPERESNYRAEFRYSRPFSYVSRGMYCSLLQPYFHLFDRDQIKLVPFEQIESNPRALASDLYKFVGVDAICPDFEFAQRINSARDGNEQMSDDTREHLRQVFTKPNQELADFIGLDVQSWGVKRNSFRFSSKTERNSRAETE